MASPFGDVGPVHARRLHPRGFRARTGVATEDAMIEKVVRKGRLEDIDEVRENLAYWLSKTPEERVSEVERLRRQRHGELPPLQRIVRIMDRK